MDALGLNTEFLVAQLAVALMLLALPISALVDLGKKKLEKSACCHLGIDYLSCPGSWRIGLLDRQTCQGK
jgi:hypothetical protein